MNSTEPKQWAAVELEVQPDSEELAGWVLMQNCGATACEVKTGTNGRMVLNATFPQKALTREELKYIVSELIKHGVIEHSSEVRSEAVVQQDWLAKWKEGFVPFTVGERLLVCPVWEQENAKEMSVGRKTLLVEPGMAFGTGLHATTRFCLQTIEKAKPGPRLLDVGTGSGILAIAAVLLDDKVEVVAIDNDPVAIEVATQNCKLNATEERIRLISGTTEMLDESQFDDILSNITCEDIISLLPEYNRLLKPGGTVICAGILAEKLPLLDEAAVRNGFRIGTSEVTEPWCGLVLIKPSV